MQAYHKAEKQKALKKAKAEKTKLRTEKLARKNPDRIQRQVDDLKALEESGQIKPFERKQLGELEAELKAVKKAREALGIKNEERKPRSDGGAHGRARPGAGPGAGAATAANKIPVGHNPQRGRGWGNGEESDSGESTSSSVRGIPMPPGTPPPLPHKPRQPHALPPKPVMPAPVTTYSAAPIVRDLRKEAASFVPAAVQRKVLGKRKEREASTEGTSAGHSEEVVQSFSERVVINAAPEVGQGRVGRPEELDEEYERFRTEMEMEGMDQEEEE